MHHLRPPIFQESLKSFKIYILISAHLKQGKRKTIKSKQISITHFTSPYTQTHSSNFKDIAADI